MTEPVLSLCGVTKSFGGLCAADNVDLEIPKTQLHALIGPNGAGKSTMINLIAGTLKPDHGIVRLGGENITRLKAATRCRRGLARTFQVSSLIMPFTALANVMLAVQAAAGHSFHFFRSVHGDPAIRDPACNALERVGLLARADIPVSALSHGERRQLELAMALALKPQILLLDEPMAGLGPRDARGMIDLLGDLKSTMAILLVEHDMDAVFALADQISVLVYGKVIASGTPAAVRRSPQVQSAYLGADI